jgi:hypothetical protein
MEDVCAASGASFYSCADTPTSEKATCLDCWAQEEKAAQRGIVSPLALPVPYRTLPSTKTESPQHNPDGMSGASESSNTALGMKRSTSLPSFIDGLDHLAARKDLSWLEENSDSEDDKDESEGGAKSNSRPDVTSMSSPRRSFPLLNSPRNWLLKRVKKMVGSKKASTLVSCQDSRMHYKDVSNIDMF